MPSCEVSSSQAFCMVGVQCVFIETQNRNSGMWLNILNMKSLSFCGKKGFASDFTKSICALHKHILCDHLHCS